MTDLSTPKQRLIDHLRAHAVRTDGPFTLRSGAISDWYIDARQTTFDGHGAVAVGDAVLAVLDERVSAVGGLTMGADPIAVATAVASAHAGRPLRAFSVRKEAKGHGMGGRLVGPIGAGDVVAVVEDTTTTGSALFEAVGALVEAHVEVSQIVVLVDRSGGAAAREAAERGLRYVTLATPEELGVEA